MSPDRSRVYRTHAVILRRRDHADADRILTVYTPAYGKRQLIAKGVRKTTSRKAGHLEIFSHSILVVAQGRTWDIVTEAVIAEPFRHLRTDLEAISRAGYLCELVDAFTETDDENVHIWDLLLLALGELDRYSIEGGLDPNALLRWFELNLLNLTGFQPQLFNCIQCDEDLEPVVNYFSVAEGGVLCPTCGAHRAGVEPLEPDALKVMRFLQTHAWPAARPLTVRPHIMHRIDNLLYRFLLSVLERRLRSADFMHRLAGQFPAPIATP